MNKYPMVKLEDIFLLQMGKTPSRSNIELWKNGRYNWISISDLTLFGKYTEETKEKLSDLAVQKSGIKITPKDTIIMSFKLSIGKTAITTEDVYTNEAIMSFIDRKKYNINIDYIYHLFSNKNWNNDGNRAVMGITLNKATLSNIQIPLPPIEEQHHIANVLDKVTAQIDNCKKILKNLDLLVKSKFMQMFGDPVINEKKFCIKRLQDISEYYNGLTYSPDDISNTGTIVLRSSNVQNNKLDFDDIVRVHKNIKENLFVKENDILMCSRNGSAKLVGKVALIKNIKENMSFGAFMMIIRSEYYHYLMIYFQLDAFRRQIKTGATTTINQITLPIPPIELQNQFAEFVEKQKTTTQNTLNQLETLKNAIMQKYFSEKI